jgi:hypothetical protein
VISRIVPALFLVSCACTMTVEKRDDGAPARGAASATADRGPMAPDPAGKPVRFALDGVEMGMSFEEVKKVWGKPASGSDEAHLRYVDKAGYAKVDLAANGAPLVLVGFELYPKEGAEPLKADAMAQLTRQFGPPVTDAQELGLKFINRSDETKTLFRAARYAYVAAWWLPDFKQEDVIRLWKVEVALHPVDILPVPAAEWASLRWPIPWAPVGSLKTTVETLETGKAKPSEVEALLGPPVRVHRNESGYDVWEYWFWKPGPRAEFQFQDGVLYGRGVNE